MGGSAKRKPLVSRAAWTPVVYDLVTEEVVKRKIKTTRKKIFKCLFIILSGLFKMNSIYGNEPLNEAIYNRYIGSAWH